MIEICTSLDDLSDRADRFHEIRSCALIWASSNCAWVLIGVSSHGSAVVIAFVDRVLHSINLFECVLALLRNLVVI